MNNESRVVIVVDGGSSVRQEFPEVVQRGVIVLPLDLQFTSGGNTETFSGADITNEDFYRRMRASSKLPMTSGVIEGRATDTFRRLVNEGFGIVSYHITSEHSGSYASGVNAAKTVRGEYPDSEIEIVDTRQLSIGTWFLAEQAAELAQQGARVDDIRRITLETIPLIETEVALDTMKNIVESGRLPPIAGWVGAMLRIRPVVGVVEGKIEPLVRSRSMDAARKELIDRAKKRTGEIVRLAVVHTNDPQGAEEMVELVSEFYPRGKIRVYDAGPVIAVHTGENASGLMIQRKW